MRRSASLSLGFTSSLAWRSLICPPWSADGRAWPPALSYTTFCGQLVTRRRREKHRRRACIAGRQTCSGSPRVARASGRRARGSAAFGVFACLRSPPFGISSLRVSRCKSVSTRYGAKPLARLTRFARETCSLGNTIFPPAFGGTKNLLRNRVAFLRLRSCPPLPHFVRQRPAPRGSLASNSS
jgi:hypothetical protein